MNIQRIIKFAKDDKVIVIINTGSDDKNVTLCKRIIDELKDLKAFWKKNKYYVYNEESDQPEESGMNC